MPPDPAIALLLELTALPTASGKELRVIDFIRRWVAERPDLRLREDDAINLVVERAANHHAPTVTQHPLYITAHLDHPAFVVERIIAPGTIELSFRGGVMDPYFREAKIDVFPAGSDKPLRATLLEKRQAEPFHLCLAELESGARTNDLTPGDVARWTLPDSEIKDGILHTHACDDLAAAAAALIAMDRLRPDPAAAHVKLLFTRAEEIGFIGAIAACKLGTMEKRSRVLALENSRSFLESPIGGGPIVRVGDRISTFSPALTGAVARVAESLAGGADPSIGTPKPAGASGAAPVFQWQRKLMAGGACEASAFQSYGYDATCICLPLGNYHNMADLEKVQAANAEAIASAKVAPEYIALSDYFGMIELLVACGTRLAGAEPLIHRMERYYKDKAFVLEG